MKQHGHTNALILTIESDGVVGAFVDTANTTATPAHMLQIGPTFQEAGGATRLATRLKANLQKLLEQLQKQSLHSILGHAKQPEHVYCFLSSPWYIPQTKIIRTSFKAPTLITRRLIEDLIAKEKKDLVGVDTDMSILENKIVTITLNGYETAVPYGKTAREVEIVVHTGIASKVFLEQITSTVKHFYHKPVEFHSLSLVLFGAVRQMAATEQNFLILDITPQTTEVSIVKKDILVQSISLPLGTDFFIKQITQGLTSESSVALSAFRLYVDGKSDSEMTKHMDDMLKTPTEAWKTALYKGLTDVSEEFFIPRHIYVRTDPEFGDFFVKMITADGMKQFSVDKGAFTVEHFDKNVLALEREFLAVI